MTPTPAPEINLFQDLFYALADGAAIHHVLYDASGKVYDTEIITINEPWRKIMHMEGREVRGLRLSENLNLRPVNGRESMIDLYARVAEMGLVTRENVFYPDENRFFQVTLTRIAPEYVAAVFHETTEYELLWLIQHSIFNSVSDAVFVYNAETGALMDLNQKAQELVGRPRGALLGMAVLPGEPEGYSATRAEFLQHVRAGETEMQKVATFEVRNAQRWFEMRAQVADAAGKKWVVLLAHDITALHRQMQALAESEDRYRTVSEIVSDFAYAFTVGPSGAITLDWVTDAFTAITGCTEEDAKAQIQTDYKGFMSRYAHAEDQILVLDAWKRVIEQGSIEIEYRMLDQKGENLWVRLAARCIPVDNQGYKVYGMVKDITDRVHAEATYLAIFNAVNDSIFVHDIDTGKIIDLNIQAALMMGYPRDEIIGRLRLPHESYEAAQHRATLIHRAALGDLLEDESPYYTTDGEERWVESRFKAGIIGGKRRVVSVARDITERKLFTEAIERSEERNRFISSLISDTAFMLNFESDNKWSLEWISDAYKQLTGYTYEDIRAGFADGDIEAIQQRFIHPDDVWKITRDLRRVYSGRQIIQEFRIMRKNRRPVWVRGYFQPILEDKRLVGICCALQDITGLLQAERNYRALFEAAHDALLVLDAGDGSVLDANQRGDAIIIEAWAANPEALLLNNIFEDVSREEFLKLLQAAAAGAEFERAWQVRLPTRKEPYTVFIQPVEIGGEKRALLILRSLSSASAAQSAA